MQITTVPVTLRAFDQSGNPVVGARVLAKLNRTEQSNGFVVPEQVEGITNAQGIAVLNLWPNELGSNGSSYRIRAWNPDTGSKFLDASAVVPNAPADIDEIILKQPYPAVDAAEAALIAVNLAKSEVLAGAASASASAQEAAASVGQISDEVQQAQDAAAEASISAGLAAQAISTTQSKATEAANSAAAAAESATAASASSTTAGASASAAQAFKSDAADSAALALTRATAAATSATNAATSATAAAASASTASAKAGEASTSATTASDAAVSASSSATTASAQATTATDKAAEATTRANNAAASATAAANSATTALTSASNAAASATAASTSASGAATSATNAATARSAAESARDLATTKATEAVSASVSAMSSASNAAASATVATTKAGEAASSASAANDAKVAAETAAANVVAAIGGGVTSFNSRNGAVVLSSSDVTGALGYTPQSSAARGAANGYAPLDSEAKIPALFLPSYVDDVVEGATLGAFPASGEGGKIYVALDTNKSYRWSGSVYVEIAASPGSTDAVPEGATNLYYTNTRARGAVSSTSSALSYAAATGVFTLDADLNAIGSLSGNAGLLRKTAADTWALDTNNYLTGNQTITFSGDASGSGSTSVVLSLANSGVVAGTYGSDAAIPVLTVDAKGRVTSVSTQSVAIPSGSLSFTGDVTGSGSTGGNTTLTLANSGVTAGTYPKVTVDAKGRVTAGAALSSADLPTYTGTLTGEQVTGALGFTPYSSANPSGYLTTATANANYLPLAGGDISGGLSVAGLLKLGWTTPNSLVFLGTDQALRTVHQTTAETVGFDGYSLRVSGVSLGVGNGGVTTNTALGNLALSSNSTTAGNNTAVGNRALRNNTSGAQNTAVGSDAMSSVVSTSFNTAVGAEALPGGGGGSNSVLGYRAGYSISSTGQNNVIIGREAGRDIFNGSGNTAVGAYALLTSGASVSNNTAVGHNTGQSLTFGAGNTFIGHSAGFNTTNGQNNLYIGARGSNALGSGHAMTSGSRNVIVGSFSGNENTLDIRTLSNQVILSDGDSNVRLHFNELGQAALGHNTLPWGTTWRVLRIGASNLAWNSNAPSALQLVGNARDTSDGAWLRTDAGRAYRLWTNPGNGSWYFEGAPADVASTNVTWARNLCVNSFGIGLSDTIPSQGIGIRFPATNSSSSDANTLDDYEEGAWTPAIVCGGAAYGGTYTSRDGVYNKVGNLVTVQGTMRLQNIGSSTSGVATITGLPFTPAFSTGGDVAHYANISVTGLIARVRSGFSTIDLLTPTSGSLAAVNFSSFNTGGAEIEFSFTYRTF